MEAGAGELRGHGAHAESAESAAHCDSPQEQSTTLKDSCQIESFVICESSQDQGGLFRLHGLHEESTQTLPPVGQTPPPADQTPPPADQTPPPAGEPCLPSVSLQRQSSKHDSPRESFGQKSLVQFEINNFPREELSKPRDSFKQESVELNDPALKESTVLCDSLQCETVGQFVSPLKELSKLCDSLERNLSELHDSPHEQLPKPCDSLEQESSDLNDSSAPRDSPHLKAFGLPDLPHSVFPKLDSAGLNDSAVLNYIAGLNDSARLNGLPEGDWVLIRSDVESHLMARRSNILPCAPLNTSPSGEERTNIVIHAPLSTSPSGEERTNIVIHAPLSTSPSGEERTNIVIHAPLSTSPSGEERTNIVIHAPLSTSPSGEERRSNILPHAPSEEEQRSNILPHAPSGEERLGNLMSLASLIARIVGVERLCTFLSHSPLSTNTEERMCRLAPGAPLITPTAGDSGGGGGEMRDVTVQVNKTVTSRMSQTPSGWSGLTVQCVGVCSACGCSQNTQLQTDTTQQNTLVPADTPQQNVQPLDTLDKTLPLPSVPLFLLSHFPSSPAHQTEVPSADEMGDCLDGPPPGLIAPISPEEADADADAEAEIEVEVELDPWWNSDPDPLPKPRNWKRRSLITETLSQREDGDDWTPSEQRSTSHAANVFVCTVCEKVFRSKTWLTRHSLEHTRNTKGQPYSCDICWRSYNFLDSLLRHRQSSHGILKPQKEYKQETETEQETETPAAVFVCSLCEKVFGSRDLLEHHSLEHAEDTETKVFGSRDLLEHHSLEHAEDTETKVFGSRDLLEHHSLEHAEDTETKPHPCDICHKSFDQMTNLIRHKKLSHNVSHSSPSQQETESSASACVCSVCGTVFKSRYLLTVHSLVHKKDTTRKPYPCDICRRSYFHLPSLKKHRRIAHAVSQTFLKGISAQLIPSELESETAVFDCTMCMKAFKTSTLLKHHYMEHNEERSRKTCACDLCDKSYNHLRSLNRHRKEVHGIPEPLSAVEYRSLSPLKRTADSPFPCDICHKGFSVQHNLTRHRRLCHSEEVARPLTNGSSKAKDSIEVTVNVPEAAKPRKPRSWKCGICGKVFSRSAALYTHQQLFHAKTFAKAWHCEVCGKDFQYKSGLERHYICHTGERPHACELCGRCYRTTTGLRQHYLKQHKWDSVAKDSIEKAGDAIEGNVAEYVNAASSASSVLTGSGLEDHLDKDFFESFYIAADLQTHAEKEPAQESETERKYGGEAEGRVDRSRGGEERDNMMETDKETGRRPGWKLGRPRSWRGPGRPKRSRNVDNDYIPHWTLSDRQTDPSKTDRQEDDRAKGVKRKVGRPKKIPLERESSFCTSGDSWMAPTDGSSETDQQEDERAKRVKRKSGRLRTIPLERESSFWTWDETDRQEDVHAEGVKFCTSGKYTQHTLTKRINTGKYAGVTVEGRADLTSFIQPCSVVLEPLPLHHPDLEMYSSGQSD